MFGEILLEKKSFVLQFLSMAVKRRKIAYHVRKKPSENSEFTSVTDIKILACFRNMCEFMRHADVITIMTTLYCKLKKLYIYIYFLYLLPNVKE